MVKIGLENDNLEKVLRGKRIALVVNQASVDSEGVSSIDIIKKKANLVALLALEHGVRGTVLAGESIDDDQEDGIPVYSLYKGDGIALDKKLCNKFDAIVFDIQDLGLRFYTYVASLKMLISSAAENNLQLIVLDRPSPLGRKISGNILSHDSFSFVGPDELPIRYGLTLGEIASYFNDKLEKKADLTVIKLSSWHGEMWPKCGRTWIATSPNIPDFETAFVYSGTCLFEGLNISEGRGTAAPFRIIGAPFISLEVLLSEISKLDVQGANISGIDYTPLANKFANTLCHGIKIDVTDYEKFDPVIFSFKLISLLFKLFPETEANKPLQGSSERMIDRLMGNGMLEDLLEDEEKILQKLSSDSISFKKEIESYYLY